MADGRRTIMLEACVRPEREPVEGGNQRRHVREGPSHFAGRLAEPSRLVRGRDGCWVFVQCAHARRLLGSRDRSGHTLSLRRALEG